MYRPLRGRSHLNVLYDGVIMIIIAQSSRRELIRLPSSHTTVRTGPYTAVHDHYDLAHTISGRIDLSLSALLTIAPFVGCTGFRPDSSVLASDFLIGSSFLRLSVVIGFGSFLCFHVRAFIVLRRVTMPSADFCTVHGISPRLR